MNHLGFELNAMKRANAPSPSIARVVPEIPLDKLGFPDDPEPTAVEAVTSGLGA
jgi:hypothetical protein